MPPFWWLAQPTDTGPGWLSMSGQCKSWQRAHCLISIRSSGPSDIAWQVTCLCKAGLYVDSRKLVAAQSMDLVGGERLAPSKRAKEAVHIGALSLARIPLAR